MDDSNVLLFLEHRLGEMLLDACLSFVNVTPNHVEVWERAVGAGDLHGHVTAGRHRRWPVGAGPVQDPKVSDCDTQTLAAHADFGLPLVKSQHRSLDSQDAHHHARSDLRRRRRRRTR